MSDDTSAAPPSASAPTLDDWHAAAIDTSAAQRMYAIQLRTHCIYAPASRIWGCPPWPDAAPLDVYLQRIAQDFARFTNVARELRLDGYAVELPGPGFGATLAELARTTRRVLTFLSEHDPAGDRCLDAEVERPGWVFLFGGEPFFVNAFAPCYPVDHSRYAFGDTATLLLFQPRHSFARAFRDGQSQLPDIARARIRQEFEAHGRAYDTAISAVPFEAYRIIRPLRTGDPEVRWWES